MSNKRASVETPEGRFILAKQIVRFLAGTASHEIEGIPENVLQLSGESLVELQKAVYPLMEDLQAFEEHHAEFRAGKNKDLGPDYFKLLSAEDYKSAFVWWGCNLKKIGQKGFDLSLKGFGRLRDASVKLEGTLYADELLGPRALEYLRWQELGDRLKNPNAPDYLDRATCLLTRGEVSFFAVGDNNQKALIEGHIEEGVICGVRDATLGVTKAYVTGGGVLSQEKTNLLKAYAKAKGVTLSREVKAQLHTPMRALCGGLHHLRGRGFLSLVQMSGCAAKRVVAVAKHLFGSIE